MPRVFFKDVLSNFHDSYIFKTPLTSVSVIYFSEIFVNIGVLEINIAGQVENFELSRNFELTIFAKKLHYRCSTGF